MDLVLAGPIMSGLVLGLKGKVYLEYICCKVSLLKKAHKAGF